MKKLLIKVFLWFSHHDTSHTSVIKLLRGEKGERETRGKGKKGEREKGKKGERETRGKGKKGERGKEGRGKMENGKK